MNTEQSKNWLTHRTNKVILVWFDFHHINSASINKINYSNILYGL